MPILKGDRINESCDDCPRAGTGGCQKRTYTVLEIQDILSISRPTAYALIRKNYFRSIRVGGQIRVSKKSFDEWLDRGNGGDAHE